MNDQKPNYSISSVQTYLDYIFDIINVENTIINCRNYFYFRGQGNRKWDIIPSLCRERTSAAEITILNEERNLIESVKFRLPDIFHDGLQPLDLLSKLQHYGIPTRLLDITTNPLVALFFACESESDSDGEVIVFQDKKFDISVAPLIQGICESYKFAQGTFFPLHIFYENILEQPYFYEQKSDIKNHKEGASWIKDCCEDIFFVNAKDILNRQKSQQGAYILFNNKISQFGEIFTFEQLVEPISKDHENIKGLITIPATVKKIILNQLKTIGISKDILFADNIDIVCEDIVRRFSTKTSD